MEQRRFIGNFFWILCLLPALTACSITESVVDTTKDAVKDIRSSPSGLKKRVLVLPIVDDAGAGPQRANQIHQDLLDRLRGSDIAVLYETTEPLSRPAMDTEPQYGMSFPPKALEIARDTGMNSILSATLNAVNTTTEKGGPLPLWPSFLPFGDTLLRYEAALTVNMSDVRCGVLLMSHVESEEKTLSVEEVQTRDAAQIIDWLLDETAPDIVERQSEKIIEVLEAAPWYGRILSVENDRIRITGGADVGMQPGMVFDVLGRGETIQCRDGRTLEILGPAMGQVEITSVMEDSSLAAPVVQGAFLSGMIIQPAS
jgi:hypothetical protein